jgi:hypothetical protein
MLGKSFLFPWTDAVKHAYSPTFVQEKVQIIFLKYNQSLDNPLMYLLVQFNS